MGPELRTGLTSAHLVQLAFPALRDLPLLAPPPERSFTELIVAPEVALTKLPATNGAPAAKTDPAPVLSPSQVRCFFECQARWWFKYGLQLPERKNISLALGLAVHQALEVNFREKLETQEDLETTGVLMVFREAWMEQVPQTEFTSDESQGDLRRLGERLVAKYMDEVAPTVEPAAVELDVQGEISGVAVRGRVDVLDVEGRLIDFKTASRRPSCVSPDYAFQLATYRQITPGASGEVRIDSLVSVSASNNASLTRNDAGLGRGIPEVSHGLSAGCLAGYVLVFSRRAGVAPWVSFGAEEPIGQFCPVSQRLGVTPGSAHSLV